MKIRTLIKQGNALDLHFIEDNSIDLIVTSPPYFGQRVYFDNDGNPITEAVGSEATTEEYLAALDAFMDEAWRVIKPTGSVFVNLGDKYEGSGGHNNANIAGEKWDGEMRRDAPTKYVKGASNVRRKSLMGLPWRFALNQADRGWVLRMDMIWDKPNSMPESVTDRVRKSHEYWFHFTKEEIYYAAIDEIREPHKEVSKKRSKRGKSEEWGEGRHPPDQPRHNWTPETALNKLGKLPSSVHRISTGGVRPTKDEKKAYDLPDHFAPFPAEWPRLIILAWSPKAWCGECGGPVSPIMKREFDGEFNKGEGNLQQKRNQLTGGTERVTLGRTESLSRTITGYKCDCETLDPSLWTPSTVLDPFAGTGTVALVSQLLNRSSISVDLSPAYVRLMNWRVRVSDHAAKLKAKWEKKGLL